MAKPQQALGPSAHHGRIVAIDALRGLVMLLMLVDHSREYFYLHAQVGDPMTLDTAPGLFATRLCAHLCAPVFIALTGLSAWLYGARHGIPAARGFLFKRGLFLVVLEITLVNFAWTFDITPEIVFLQVIWAIGLSMIALAALLGPGDVSYERRVGDRKSCPARRESLYRGVPRSRLATRQGAICGPTLRDKRCFTPIQRSSAFAQNDCAARATPRLAVKQRLARTRTKHQQALGLSRPALCLVAGLLVLGHNLLDPITFAPDQFGYTFWTILHDRGLIDLPGDVVARTSYPLLPWIGVIALGWCAGPWFDRGVAHAVRQRQLVIAASLMLGLFIVLRLVNGYGEPVPHAVDHGILLTLLSFFNLTKYPPSVDFILCYLGLGTLILAGLCRLPDRRIAWLTVFGGAPLFFYLLHLYLLHAANRLAGLFVEPSAGALVSVNHWAWIWAIAAVMALVTAPACQVFGALKRRSDAAWLRYL